MGAFVSLRSRISTRQALVETLRTIAADGLVAEPVLIGEGDEPQAVLISLEQYAALADHLDAVASAPHLRARLETEEQAGGPRVATVEDFAAEAGVDLPETGGEYRGPSPA